MKLSNFFIKKKIQELAKEVAMRTPCFCSLAEAHDVLVIFNLKDKEDVLICVQKLREFTVNIHLCAYVPKKCKEEAVDTSWLYIFENELDSKGIPTENMIDRFNALPADILIDLTRTNNYTMQYLQLKHPSLFKVGNKSFLRDIYDITITMTDNDDIKQFFEHILFYLLTIRSK
ncbi:MAG: hypothetical protein LBH58_02395 [Tannerellaceae bacterium]|jgi:hypothetical protein|nr:hypothetical protein [Tannerellaceae bacterium]